MSSNVQLFALIPQVLAEVSPHIIGSFIAPWITGDVVFGSRTRSRLLADYSSTYSDYMMRLRNEGIAL